MWRWGLLLLLTVLVCTVFDFSYWWYFINARVYTCTSATPQASLLLGRSYFNVTVCAQCVLVSCLTEFCQPGHLWASRARNTSCCPASPPSFFVPCHFSLLSRWGLLGASVLLQALLLLFALCLLVSHHRQDRLERNPLLAEISPGINFGSAGISPHAVDQSHRHR